MAVNDQGRAMFKKDANEVEVEKDKRYANL